MARQFWQTKQIAALNPLAGVLTSATADYTQRLTQAGTSKTAELRSALQDATAARNGSVGLVENQVQLASLGWTAAGAYYLEFARLNGQTLSLVSATPTVNTPSYDGLGRSLSRDLAPLATSAAAFMTKLMTYVRTTDGLDKGRRGRPKCGTGAACLVAPPLRRSPHAQCRRSPGRDRSLDGRGSPSDAGGH